MTTNNLGELSERLRQLARVPNLLVACDYDGTLAPLVDDPMEAGPTANRLPPCEPWPSRPTPMSPSFRVVACAILASLSRFPEEIRLVGSHGSEFDLGFASSLTTGSST